MKISKISGPDQITISYSDMEYYLRLTTTSGIATDEQSLVEDFIAEGREYVEAYTGRRLGAYVYDAYFEEWPDEYFQLPYGNLTSISGVYYKDTDEVETEWDSTNYLVENLDNEFGKVRIGYNKTFPTTTLSPSIPIRIRFTCGYTVSDIPKSMINAIQLMVSDAYELRNITVFGVSIVLSKTIDRLLSKYQMFYF